MKRTQLLNRHLSQLVAELGHLDEITIADAGLPVPEGIRVIDLAISPGEPRMATILKALGAELIIEGAIIADQANSTNASAILNDALKMFVFGNGVKSLSPELMEHEEFKKRVVHSKAVIRTGEITPYCNIILRSGVAF
ncbi:MAG: D-ribose pyranase [Candidatus Puniceispirillaceae bacterium]